MNDNDDTTMYIPELNFLFTLSLSRNGKIKEIKTEFDIIKLAFSIENVEIRQRLISVPLRKLLLDNKNSLLIDVCPDFKMPELSSEVYDCGDRLKYKMPYKSDSVLMSIDNWKKQVMAWYDKTSLDVPKLINKNNFKAICNSLRSNDNIEFKSYYKEFKKSYSNGLFDGFIHTNGSNDRIYELLNKAGYYQLTVYDFIKTIADKRGAHADIEITPLVTMFNNIKTTPIECFAIQMIQQAKNMVPELQQYDFQYE